MTKHFGIRIAAALFTMGSFAIGFLVGAKIGLLYGVLSFFIFFVIGICLHLLSKYLLVNKANYLIADSAIVFFHDKVQEFACKCQGRLYRGP